LLVAVGGGSSNAAALQSHAGQDRSITFACWVGEPKTGADFGGEVAEEGKVSEERVGKTATLGLRSLRRHKTDLFRGSWKHPELKARLDIEFRGARVYITGRAKTENGNPGLNEARRSRSDPIGDSVGGVNVQ
jgi:hypothetical protein